MSNKGLHIEKMGAIFAKFRRDESKKMKYTVVLLSHEDDISKEKILTYEKKPWSYVCSYESFGGDISTSFKRKC